MSWTDAISGNDNQRGPQRTYPNAAPATEYVEMPEGSSSAAPVMSPGPSSEKKRRNEGFSTGALERGTGCHRLSPIDA